jgi:hypothetical protein
LHGSVPVGSDQAGLALLKIAQGLAKASGVSSARVCGASQAFERMVGAHHEAALERALQEGEAAGEGDAAAQPFGPLQARRCLAVQRWALWHCAQVPRCASCS